MSFLAQLLDAFVTLHLYFTLKLIAFLSCAGACLLIVIIFESSTEKVS